MHGEVLLIFSIINVSFGHVWSHPWLSASALRWPLPPSCQPNPGRPNRNEKHGWLRGLCIWVQERSHSNAVGAQEMPAHCYIQWGMSSGVWMVMIYQVFCSWLCGCINQWIRFRPLIAWKSECHALSQVWGGYDVTYCIHFCCFDCQLLRATDRRVWSGDGLCVLILCHGYKMTRFMLTMWLCGDKPWQFELSCGYDSCR